MKVTEPPFLARWLQIMHEEVDDELPQERDSETSAQDHGLVELRDTIAREAIPQHDD